MTVSRFRVEGMDCAAEEQLIRMRLAQLDGIDHDFLGVSRALCSLRTRWGFRPGPRQPSLAPWVDTSSHRKGARVD